MICDILYKRVHFENEVEIMNLNQLHYFSKLAAAEHYTKAAEELGISSRP